MAHVAGSKRKAHDNKKTFGGKRLKLLEESKAARDYSQPLSDVDDDPGREAAEAVKQLAQTISNKPSRGSERRLEAFKQRANVTEKQILKIIEEKDQELAANIDAFQSTFRSLITETLYPPSEGPPDTLPTESSQVPIMLSGTGNTYFEQAAALLHDYKRMTKRAQIYASHTGWQEERWAGTVKEIGNALKAGQAVTHHRIHKLIYWDTHHERPRESDGQLGAALLAIGREELPPREKEKVPLSQLVEQISGIVSRSVKVIPFDIKLLAEPAEW